MILERARTNALQTGELTKVKTRGMVTQQCLKWGLWSPNQLITKSSRWSGLSLYQYQSFHDTWFSELNWLNRTAYFSIYNCWPAIGCYHILWSEILSAIRKQYIETIRKGNHLCTTHLIYCISAALLHLTLTGHKLSPRMLSQNTIKNKDLVKTHEVIAFFHSKFLIPMPILRNKSLLSLNLSLLEVSIFFIFEGAGTFLCRWWVGQVRMRGPHQAIILSLTEKTFSPEVPSQRSWYLSGGLNQRISGPSFSALKSKDKQNCSPTAAIISGFRDRGLTFELKVESEWRGVPAQNTKDTGSQVRGVQNVWSLYQPTTKPSVIHSWYSPYH